VSKFLFSLFLLFSFGIILYGAVIDYLFPSIASNFNFYSVHYNVASVMTTFLVGFVVCVISRLLIIQLYFDPLKKNLNFYNFTIIMKTKGPILGFFSGFIFFCVDGVTFLPERVGYVIEGGSFFSTIYAISGLCGLICIPLLALAWNSKSRFLKIICLILFLLVLLCYFAKASRVFVLGAIIYLTVAYYSGAKFSKFILFFVFSLTPISMSFIYELRGQLVQGLIPFLSFLFQGDSEYTISELFFSFFISFSGSYYIFMETVNRAYWIDFKDLWVSINPQFGSAAGWVDVFEEYRIVEAVPYSSIGEVIAYSNSFFYFFCFLLGVVFAKSEINFRYGRVIGVAQISILLYMAILMPQYNLRSIFRFFYLVLLLEAVLVIMIYKSKIFYSNSFSRYR